MAEIKDKVQNALDEVRMLILGAQVLLGFQFRSAFEPGFEKLPLSSQYLKMCGLALMLIAIGLLLTPGAYHRIVEEGEDTNEVHSFSTRLMDIALLPFAVGLGLDFYVAVERTGGQIYGIVAGVAASLVALFFWYGIEYLRRREHKHEGEEEQSVSEKKESDAGGTELETKIRQVLTEARVVLPGAQALMGFQFITTLMEAFEKLPASSKYVHLASLALVALTIILLMTPAAYHRIVERGENTEHFHRFASRILVAAMIPLALGVSGDFFVVMRKVSHSTSSAFIGAVLLLVFFYGLWFGLTIYRRRQRAQSESSATKRKERQFAS